MEKINVAELLKDCPKGMELDCTLFDDIYFDCIDNVCDIIKCYIQESKHKIGISFDKYGHYSNISKSKCVIFPKGKTTWEGFQRPFKDGDILVNILGDIYIRKAVSAVNFCGSYASVNSNGVFISHYTSFLEDSSRYATEEEKQKLFDAIKANGYKWNEETKTLEKLPTFKVEDKIEKCGYRFTIVEIKDNYYLTKCGNKIPIDNQDDFSLVPNKFDITTLKPFDKVLVRDSDKCIWYASFFSHIWKDKYFCVGAWYNQCIPYEENKHLLGTTNDCDEYYKTWE